ncbi:MAG: pentapeptide repeat-containing protein [Anaerolineae bacterium]|nr:pentapeptide repeat-containing protein [Anaerolineae bacterium]
MIRKLLDSLRKRSSEIKDERLVAITAGLFLFGVAISITSKVLEGINFARPVFEWIDGFFQNFGTEMIGAAITFLLIEILLTGRREKEAEDREKERLILQMGSPFNESAVEAARQLRHRGWGFNDDNSLQKAYLQRANLEGADLSHANLEDSNLEVANLKEAFFWEVNLKGANLGVANLKGAHLGVVNLEGASLFGANLEETVLLGTNLEGANLHAANFEGATLPDGTKLPGRTTEEREEGKPEPDWRTPFETWDKAGRLGAHIIFSKPH